MKTKKLVAAYNILNDARLSKMEDEDKFKVIKNLRKMKKTATEYHSFVEDAQKKLQPEDFEEMNKKAQEWNGKHAGAKSSDLSDEERVEFEKINEYFKEYSEKVEKCLKEEAEKEVEVDITPLSEEAFGKLVASNDWACKDIMELLDVLSE